MYTCNLLCITMIFFFYIKSINALKHAIYYYCLHQIKRSHTGSHVFTQFHAWHLTVWYDWRRFLIEFILLFEINLRWVKINRKKLRHYRRLLFEKSQSLQPEFGIHGINHGINICFNIKLIMRVKKMYSTLSRCKMIQCE